MLAFLWVAIGVAGSCFLGPYINQMDADLLLTNRNGEPQITAASVNPTVQRFDVSVHGGASYDFPQLVDDRC